MTIMSPTVPKLLLAALSFFSLVSREVTSWAQPPGSASPMPTAPEAPRPASSPPLPSVSPIPSPAGPAAPSADDAIRALNLIQSASQLVARQDPRSAKRELEKADSILKRIGPAELVPIHAEVRFATGYAPDEEGARLLEEATAALMRGDQRAAIEKLQSANAPVIYTVMSFPVKQAQGRIKVALPALEQNRLKEASRLLSDINESLRIAIRQITPPGAMPENPGAPPNPAPAG